MTEYRSLRRHRLLLLISLSFAALSTIVGCASISRITAGEPAATEDATPPPDYHPIYIKQIAVLPDQPKDRKPELQITWIDSRDPNHVRIYAHLVDSTGTYLMGASSGKWKSKWCEVADSLGGNWKTISKYGLKEVTELQRISTAMALVMDHSGSMGEDRAHAIQDAAESLIGKMQPNDALALIKYDNKVSVEAPLSTDPALLRSKLAKNGLEGFGGSTAIVDAVNAGLQELQKAKFYDRRAVVLFTDGQDNSSQLSRDSILTIARRNNTIVCAIGFGLGINEPYLLEITSPTGGLYRHVYRTGEIGDVFEDLYRRLRNYYVIDYTPPSYGLHTASLTLCLPKDTLIATGQYDNTPRVGDLALLDINFDLNKSDIPPASQTAIDNVVSLLQTYPLVTIEVRGHTDNTNNTGDPQYNLNLSKRRAEAVKAAIVKRGIRAERISALGFGDTSPVADNSTEEGRAQNRRTEFVIVSQ